MKDKKDKRKHQESTIGKIIYSFLLFAPLLAIGFTCLYAVFNKNAYESYQTENIRTVQPVNNTNTFIDTNTYEFSTDAFIDELPNIQEYYGSGYLAFKDITIDFHNYINENLLPSNLNVTSFRFAKLNNTNYRLFLKLDNNTEIMAYTETQFVNNNIHIPNFTFKLILNNSNFNWFTPTKALNMFLWQKSTVGNVFYDSIEKVEQSNLFNWSKNTAIYTVLNNTSNTLGITNTFWPMLMAYWLLISVIYILYDIILMMLVIFHRKVHCLQDSV